MEGENWDCLSWTLEAYLDAITEKARCFELKFECCDAYERYQSSVNTVQRKSHHSEHILNKSSNTDRWERDHFLIKMQGIWNMRLNQLRERIVQIPVVVGQTPCSRPKMVCLAKNKFLSAGTTKNNLAVSPENMS